MSVRTAAFQQEYNALREGAALQLRPDAGVLALRGADRVDFLQRMTTNNIVALQPGHSCVTVLTSPTAKIVQVFTVLARPDDLLLLPARGEAGALSRHLRGQIFFMDNVTVEDLGGAHVRLRLMGPQAATVLAALSLDMHGAVDGEWRSREGVLGVLQRVYDVEGCELLVEPQKQAEIVTRLAAVYAVVLQDEAAYHARRIELGRPLPGAELTEEYNPLEAGLGWACAENKGCYTGQEIIARQVTYDKVTRTLVGLTGSVPLAQGTALTVNGRDVGMITSAAESPLLDAPVALAVVKRPHDAEGAGLLAGGLPVQVASLPFSARKG